MVLYHFDVCNKCDEEYTSTYKSWCRPCQINYLKNNFTNWTSGNEKIDDFIQKKQLKIDWHYDIIIEWIPYNQFIDIKKIEKNVDNAVTIYSALWNNGSLHYDSNQEELTRKPNINANTCYDDMHGISQNPDTKDYIIVLQDIYCEKCGEQYTDEYNNKWCVQCHRNYFINEFKNWASGNEIIDDIIQEIQLKFYKPSNIVVEWIPFNQFINIKEIEKVDDNTTTIYSAFWNNGPLYYDTDIKEWTRNPNIKVAIKCFNDLQDIIDELLSKAEKYDRLHELYGISQNPDTEEYIIVQDKYCKNCGEKYTNESIKWCRPCHINYFENEWTSENKIIDDIILEMQLKIDCYNDKIVEWIPYTQFINIEEIGKIDDNTATIYSALLSNGSLFYNEYKKKWMKDSNLKVTLKCFNDSQNIIDELLNETKSYYTCYGISQNPNTKECIIVSENNRDFEYKLCQKYLINYLKNNSIKWTSGNEKIDIFIQKMQLSDNIYNNNTCEWISYSQFVNIKEIEKNDLLIIHSAIWNNSPSYYNSTKEEIIRKPKTVTLITLNYLNKSQNMIDDFLNKVKSILMVNNCNVYDSFHKKYYSLICGISQNPDTGNYIIVSQDEYCEKCSKQYIDIRDKWCLCQNNLTNWSGNNKIDELIQEVQLKINISDSIVVEWIPYNQFINIKETAKDNSNAAIIYSAIWKNGPLHTSKEWIRSSYANVVLKSLDINEFSSKANNYNDIYGISQKPDTKEYIMVLSTNAYCEKCDIKEFFNKVDNYEYIYGISQHPDTKNYFIVLNDKKSIWKNGPLYYRYDKKEWIRNPYKKVILNCLALDIEEFFNKANEYNSIYGISQNPNTNDYILVLQNRNCKRCGKPYSDLKNEWCKLCEINHIQNRFANWSGNEKIDNFIQEKQIKINGFNDIVVEWIPYNQFINIKEIGKVDDNVAIIYSAIWKNGPSYYRTKSWIRNSYKKVVLKCLTLDINEFFIEVNNYNNICGISQDPNTNDYILVFQNDQYCNRCCKPYSNLKNKFCKSCQINYIQNNLTNWSGNQKIDDFIQEMHLKIDSYGNIIFEWIPYNQFECIEVVGRGGFATVCSAIWKDGPLECNYGKKICKRDNYKEIALKCIDNSHNITDEFLNEIKAYSIMRVESNNVLKVYGISQDPNTKNHIIVLQYAKCGSFNNWMRYFYKNSNYLVKSDLLYYTLKGLKEIHQKQMIHRDFHIGNILISDDSTIDDIPISICISDMGFCGEVSNKYETNIYGVMPYVAPEVLRGKPYTQAADIYSFGMVMYFIITGRQPFDDCAHDNNLVLQICSGIRPEIPEIPELKSNQYIDLMKKCWDSNPDNRPNAELISNMLPNIGSEIWKAEKYFFKDYKENNQLTTIHPQAVYTSRLLNPYTEDLAIDFTELNDEK
ncbi:unnamed protein product [Rhizophagus irregularis]|nr:unnamed protein product [Rhizophagus irregularis]